jgi:hypothetical protein
VDAEDLGTSVRGLSRIHVGNIGDMGVPTRSFGGSSGTVASTSDILDVRLSTNVSKSFFAAR